MGKTKTKNERSYSNELAKNWFNSIHVSIGSQTNLSGIITKNQDEGWKLKAPKPVSTTFVWSLENSFTKKRTYNEIVYDLSQIIYLSSPKTYNLMRQFIPLPSFQKLYFRFGDEISNEKVFLDDLQEIGLICQINKRIFIRWLWR